MNLDGLENKKFCVIGDLIVDHYRYLRATRLSPEAPVAIFKPVSEEWLPGGAANVANNLTAMGADVTLCSVVGPDWPGIRKHMKPQQYRENFVVDLEGRMTTIKERLVSKSQQIARIDIQNDAEVSDKAADALVSVAKAAIEAADVIVFSDYDHGVMRGEAVVAMVVAAGDKPTVVDTKAPNSIIKYRDCTIALPNHTEARVIADLADDFDEEDVAKFILRTMRLRAIGLTLGPKGILLVTNEQHGTDMVRSNVKATLFPPLTQKADEVVDVTGAGDTVTAAVAAGLALGMPYDETMRLANAAAGVVVMKRGVATASVEEIARALGQ